MDLWCFRFVFILMSDELMLVNGDCELNLCYLWCVFFFGFLAFWLCDSLSLCVCDSLSLLYYIDKRDRERESRVCRD